MSASANDLARPRLAYLATPYSKYPKRTEAACEDAAARAAQLMVAGIDCYSPIAHTHPLAIHGKLDPLDHAIWLPFDETMMAKADVLIVARMEGWEFSRGMAHEIEVFTRAGKAIWDLWPETMDMKKRERLG